MRAAALLMTAALLIAAPIPSAHAAEPAGSTQARDQARELGKQGIAAYKAGRFAECIDHMRQAETLFHAPAHLLYRARCHAELGQLVEAHGLYVDIAVEAIPSYAAAAFHQAQAEAKAQLQVLRSQVAGLAIRVSGVRPEQATVTVDGVVVPTAKLAHVVALQPGEHVVEGRAEGVERISRKVQTAVGPEPTPVELVLEPPPAPPGPTSPVAPAGPGTPTPTAPATQSVAPLRVPGAVLLALGGAGLVAGGITGVLTLSQAGDIKDDCNGTDCPVARQADADAAKTLGNASTGLFIAGGVVAAAGIVMLLIPPEEAPTENGAQALELSFGAGTMALRGVF